MPLAVAVGAFLDCEHYVFLHRNVMTKTEVLYVDGRRVKTQQTLKAGILRVGHTFILEYFPPGHFKTHSIEPYPNWLPSIHHFIKTTIDVKFSRHPLRDTCVMEFAVEMDISFWLFPLRNLIRKQIEKMHRIKDQEDIKMIQRRARLFGRSNISYYLSPGQFIMHKNDYIKYFAPQKNADLIWAENSQSIAQSNPNLQL